MAFEFPIRSLRTTNIIERLNEFERRTKSMEIVAGEQVCYTLLAFISLKMELSWRSALLEKCVKIYLSCRLKISHNLLDSTSVVCQLEWFCLDDLIALTVGTEYGNEHHGILLVKRISSWHTSVSKLASET
jgi:hypothetical protein